MTQVVSHGTLYCAFAVLEPSISAEFGRFSADVEARFGGMYRAFQYGAPPHGGMAAGVDRIVMLVCGAEDLREITLFPMNQRAEDLLMGAPSDPTPKQLRESHIRLNLPE